MTPITYLTLLLNSNKQNGTTLLVLLIVGMLFGPGCGNSHGPGEPQNDGGYEYFLSDGDGENINENQLGARLLWNKASVVDAYVLLHFGKRPKLIQMSLDLLDLFTGVEHEGNGAHLCVGE